MSKKSKAATPMAAAWSTLQAEGSAILANLPDDTFAATVLAGAFQVGQSDNPIRGNLCAAGLRELAGHILHSLASNQQVMKSCWYKPEPDTKGPTRRQRVTFIMQGGLPVAFVTSNLKLDGDRASGPLIKAMDALNRATHLREETVLFDDFEVRTLIETALRSLFDVFEAARACRNEVERHLEAEISETVLDAFLGETIQELDELSTHTTYSSHYVDEIKVTLLDAENIDFRVSGTVYVELQYGSNSDVRNDIGGVTSDSFPFSARLSAKAREPTKLFMNEGKLSVDNSSFYE